MQTPAQIQSFHEHVTKTARKHGFSCEIDPQTGYINMSSRNSAGDDEPHPAVIKAGRSLAKDISDLYPAVKADGVFTMEFVDEWVELSIATNQMKNLTKEKS